MYAKIALATIALAAVASAAPTLKVSKRAVTDAYTLYQGDGSAAAGWPSQESWGSYDELWATNSAVMKNSCGWNGWGADDSDAEISAINDAIQQVAGTTGVDSRFILAIVMQESKGCVRAPTTDNGVVNPGLMQSHNGSGTCDGVNPCPADQILQMITDGTAGTASGDGLQQTLAATTASIGTSDAQAVYAAARMYNSGSVNYSNLNDGITSTACYAVDVANRLTGWALATTGCNL
ncbi:hypothetical protein SLS62_006392 [Diatrype stigma]|uniref:Muramidase n=1 Tax=Diatrype stigma TaxID=117547 RepID=A0AAN9YP60_9PEZI